MTAIVSFSVRRHPVMLGDLVLSGPEPDEQIMRVPSVGPVTNIFPEGCGYTITGLKQKLAVIHPDLAMAWAGSYIKARSVATELRQLTSGSEINLDSISGFVEEVQQDNTLQDLSIILLVSDRQAALVHTLWVRALGYSTDHYGRVCIAGSGYEDTVSLLKDLERSELANQSDLSPVNLAIFYAGSLAASMLTLDVTNRHSLLRYYGGGSEIVTLIGGEFAKVDKLAYVIWFAYVVNPEEIRMFDPIRIMYYSYRQDHLFLHALGFDPYADKAHRTTDNARYLIDPIYASTRLDAITEFEREILGWLELDNVECGELSEVGSVASEASRRRLVASLGIPRRRTVNPVRCRPTSGRRRFRRPLRSPTRTSRRKRTISSPSWETRRISAWNLTRSGEPWI